MNEQHPIDNLFRQGFEGHEIKPSGAVWERVSSAGGHKRRTNWQVYIAAAITVTVALGSYLNFSSRLYAPAGSVMPLLNEEGTTPIPRPTLQPYRHGEESAQPTAPQKNTAPAEDVVERAIRYGGYRFARVEILEAPDEPIAWEEFALEPLDPALWPLMPQKASPRFRHVFEVTDPSRYALEIPQKEENPREDARYGKALINYAGTQLEKLVKGESLDPLPLGLGGLFAQGETGAQQLPESETEQQQP